MLVLAPRPRLPGVAVVAPDRRLRDSLASVLSATGRLAVVGAAGDSPAALRLAGSEHPDVILVDPTLAGVGDGRLLAGLRRRAPQARILVLAWDDGSPPLVPRHADGVLDATGLPGALLEALASAARASD